jgi:hypothetical protein
MKTIDFNQQAIQNIKYEISEVDKRPVNGRYSPMMKLQDLAELEEELRFSLITSIATDRLSEICTAEREGRVVVLPCKVGDTVYFLTKQYDIVNKLSNTVIDEYIVTEIRGNKYNPLWYMASSERCIHRDFTPGKLGKTVFLDKAQAEAALAEKEAGE